MLNYEIKGGSGFIRRVLSLDYLYQLTGSTNYKLGDDAIFRTIPFTVIGLLVLLYLFLGQLLFKVLFYLCCCCVCTESESYVDELQKANDDEEFDRAKMVTTVDT